MPTVFRPSTESVAEPSGKGSARDQLAKNANSSPETGDSGSSGTKINLFEINRFLSMIRFLNLLNLLRGYLPSPLVHAFIRLGSISAPHAQTCMSLSRGCEQ